MTFMGLPVQNQLIDIGGLIVLLVVVFGLIYKIRSGLVRRFDFLNVLESEDSRKETREARSNVVAKSIAKVLFYDVFTTKPLETCSRTKRASHLLIFWGFALTGLSTVLAFLTNPNNVVLPLTNPVKISGNAGGILIAIGFIVMFSVRYQESGSPWKLTRSDYFLLVLFFTVVTGFATQQAIYSSLGPEAVSATFWIHIVLIVLLLATAPFTKFSHAISKPVTLLYEEIDRRRGKEPLLPSGSKKPSE